MLKIKPNSSVPQWFTVVTLVLGIAFSTSAVTYVWTGAGANDYWSTPGNWSGAVAPSAGEAGIALVFSNGYPKTVTNDIVGLAVAAIQFQGSNYVVHGKPSGNSLGFRGTGLGGFGLTANGNNCQFAGSCPLVLSNAGIVLISGTNTLKLSSSISGPGGITKSGPGSLLFNATQANTYSGTTMVTDGTVDLDNGFLLFASFVPLVSVPATLTIGSTNLSYSPIVRLLADNQIADTAAVTVNGNARLSLNSYDDTLGGLTIQAGFIDTTLGGTNPGTLTLNGDVTVLRDPLGFSGSTIWGKLNLGNSTRSIEVETSTVLVISGEISANQLSAGLTKTGAGELWLESFSGAGTNTYGGPTLISEGILDLGQTTLGSTNSGTIVSSNAQLILLAPAPSTEPLTLNGSPTIASLVASDSVWTGDVVLIGDVGIAVDGGNKLILQSRIGGTGGLRLAGLGTVTLSGNWTNTYTGVTTVNSGTVELARTNLNANTIPGDLIINGGVVEWHAEAQIANSSAVTLNAPGVANVNGWFDGVASLSGDGQLNLGSYGFAISSTSNCTFAGQIIGTGYLAKWNTGTVTLTGNNSAFVGKAYIYGGTLNAVGNLSQCQILINNDGKLAGGGGGVGSIDVYDSGTLAPGTNGSGVLEGNGHLGFGGTTTKLEAEINGDTPGVGYDQVTLTGLAQLNGQLQIHMNYPGAAGKQFTIIQGSDWGTQGEFVGLPAGALLTNNGVVFQIAYNGGAKGSDVVLTQIGGGAAQIDSIHKLANGNLQLTATGSPNALYTVSAATNLNPPVIWNPIGAVPASAAGQLSFTDSQAAQFTQRFYRFSLP